METSVSLKQTAEKNWADARCGASAQFVKDNGVGGSKVMLGNDEMLLNLISPFKPSTPFYAQPSLPRFLRRKSQTPQKRLGSLSQKQLETVLQTDRSEDLIEAVNRIEQLVAVRI